jgi:hypothetical protein
MRQALRSISIPAADHQDCCDNRSLVADQMADERRAQPVTPNRILPLIQFLIDDLDRAVDLGTGHAELIPNQLHQEVDPLDERPTRFRSWLRPRLGFFSLYRSNEPWNP